MREVRSKYCKSSYSLSSKSLLSTPKKVITNGTCINNKVDKASDEQIKSILSKGDLSKEDRDMLEQQLKVREKRREKGKERKLQSAIDSGLFRPLNISKDVMRVFQENAEKIGQPNPLEDALPVIAEIKAKLFEVPLTEEMLPEFINPFDNPLVPSTYI